MLLVGILQLAPEVANLLVRGPGMAGPHKGFRRVLVRRLHPSVERLARDPELPRYLGRRLVLWGHERLLLEFFTVPVSGHQDHREWFDCMRSPIRGVRNSD